MSNENDQKELWKKFNKRRKEPNIFKTLGMMDGAENRNSNFLAWLLNPQETHKLGTAFLEKFLKSVKISCDNLNLESVNICREKPCENGRPDIIIENEKFICVIEVKFGAGETGNQHENYTKTYNREICQKPCYYIHLDIEKREYEKYKPATWKNNVLDVLKEKDIKNDIINQYISFLEEKFYICENTDINPEQGLNSKIKELRKKVKNYLNDNKYELNITEIWSHDGAKDPFSVEFHPTSDNEVYYFLEFTEEKLCLKKLVNKKYFNENDISKYKEICEKEGSYFKFCDKNLITEKTIIDGDDYIDTLYDNNIDILLKKIDENVKVENL